MTEEARVSFVAKIMVFEARAIPAEFASTSDCMQYPRTVGYSAECAFGDYTALKTQIAWNDQPFFGEEFSCEIDGTEELTIVLMRFKKKGGLLGHFNSEKGRVFTTKTIPFSNFQRNKVIEDWFKFYNKGEVFCEIRLRVTLEEYVVLPSSRYQKLSTFLFDDARFQIITTLSQNSRVDPADKTTFAELLCQAAHGKGKDAAVLKHILTLEIQHTATEEVLFRGNSVGTKAFDYYFKMVGLPWLSLFQPLIKEVAANEEIRCEISQGSMIEGDEIEKNLQNLTQYINKALAIIYSPEVSKLCPPTIREVLKAIRQASDEKFPGGRATYISSTSFVFLRFWVAAIRTPKLFLLSDTFYSGNVKRNLTLIGSVLQKLANFSEFEQREAHMHLLNPLLQANTAKIKALLDDLSSGPLPDHEDSQVEFYDTSLAFSKLIPILRAHADIFKASEVKNLAQFWKEVSVVETAMKESNAKIQPVVRTNVASEKRRSRVSSALLDPGLTPSTSNRSKRTRSSKSLSMSEKLDSIKNKFDKISPPPVSPETSSGSPTLESRSKSDFQRERERKYFTPASVKFHFPGFNTKIIPLSSPEYAATPLQNPFEELCTQAGLRVAWCVLTDTKTGNTISLTTPLSQLPPEITVTADSTPRSSSSPCFTPRASAPSIIVSQEPSSKEPSKKEPIKKESTDGASAVLKAFENSAPKPIPTQRNFQPGMAPMYSGFGPNGMPMGGMGMMYGMNGMVPMYGMGGMPMGMNGMPMMGMNGMPMMGMNGMPMMGMNGMPMMGMNGMQMAGMNGMPMMGMNGMPMMGMGMYGMSPGMDMYGMSPGMDAGPIQSSSCGNVSSAPASPNSNIDATDPRISGSQSPRLSPRLEMRKEGDCAECFLEITEEQKAEAISLLGKEYHHTCFKCSKCLNPVGLGSHKIGGKFVTCDPCFQGLLSQQKSPSTGGVSPQADLS